MDGMLLSTVKSYNIDLCRQSRPFKILFLSGSAQDSKDNFDENFNEMISVMSKENFNDFSIFMILLLSKIERFRETGRKRKNLPPKKPPSKIPDSQQIKTLSM